MTSVLFTNGFNRTDSYHMRIIISCTNLQRNDVPWVCVNAPMYAYATWLYFIVSGKFSGLFFYMLWDISLKLGIYMQQVVLHVKFEFHSNRDTLTYFTAKNRSKSFICIHGLKNHIEASDLVHTLILWVSWSLLIFVMVGQFLALWRTKTLERGCY